MVVRYLLQLVICVAGISVVVPLVSFAQEMSELEFIVGVNPIVEPEKPRRPDRNSDSEISELGMFSVGLIRIYQKVISSQQQSTAVCTFSPSCSHFGTDAIKKFGFLRGVLLTSDRLQRCNGLGGSHYLVDPATGKFRDGIEAYDLD